MYSIIVLSHGDFAQGLKDTMTMILGTQEETYFISFTPSDSVEDFEKKVKVIYHAIPKDYQVLFLTDLYGGTPSHVASKFRLKFPQRTEVVTGVNLPVLMASVISRKMELNVVIKQLLQEAQKGIQRIEIKEEVNEEDE